MTLDIASLRAEFPIFGQRPAPFHYLDNAATGQICGAAARALLGYETGARANVKRGVYRMADEATAAFEKARAEIAAWLGAAQPDEVILTSGTTLGLNIAAHTLVGRLHPGDEILLSLLEHHSNIVPWQLAAERVGAVVRAIPVTEEGMLDLDRLEQVLTERTRIISVTHASNVTGAITDLGRLKEAASAVGALLVVDGAQRARMARSTSRRSAATPMPARATRCSARPGAGALWVRRDLLAELPPFLGGGEMIREVTIERTTYAPPPHRFEPGTPPIGPAIAMGAAAGWLATQDWSELARTRWR